jgi:hypothetical protein
MNDMLTAEQQGEVAKIQEMTVTTEMRVKALIVTDEATLDDAVTFGREVKTRGKKVEEFWDAILDPINAARNKILESKRNTLAPFLAWEKQIKTSCTDYATERDRKIEEERQRVEAEAQRIAEESRLKNAEKVEETQGREAATTLLEQPVIPAPLPPPPPAPKTAGASFTTLWKAQVVDAALIPRKFLVVDDKKLAAYAKAMKETAVVPGVRFYSEKSMGIRS